MKCKNHYLPLISGHLDGSNSEIEELRLHKHLKGCKECRELLAQLEQTELLLMEAKAEPPAELTDRIMDAVRKEPKRAASRKRFYFSTAAAGLAAAAILTFVLLGSSPLSDLAKSEDIPAEAQGNHSNEILHDSYIEYQEELSATEVRCDESPTYSSTQMVPNNDTETVTVFEPSAQSSEPYYGGGETEEDGDPPSLESTPADTVASTADHAGETLAPIDPTESLPDSPEASEPVPDQKGPTGGGSGIPSSSEGVGENTQGFTNPNGLLSSEPYKPSQSKPAPTLILWDAMPEEIPALWEYKPIEDPDALRVPVKASQSQSLYDRFLFLLPSDLAAIRSNGFRFAPQFELTQYLLPYDAFIDLLESCVGQFELSVYFPTEMDAEASCLLVLVSRPDDHTE